MRLVSAIKKELARQARLARKERWREWDEQKARERRCFLTWPFGHRYDLGKCVFCERNHFEGYG